MNYAEYVERCNNIGKTASGLAAIAGVNANTISRWKSGQCAPSPASARKLEKALSELEAADVPDLIPEGGYRGSASASPVPTANLDGELAARTAYGVTPAPNTAAPMIIYTTDNAMLLDGIPKGAQVTIIPTKDYDDGDLIACILEGNTLVRRYARKGDVVVLSCSNPKYQTIVTDLAALNRPGNGMLGLCDKVTFHVR